MHETLHFSTAYHALLLSVRKPDWFRPSMQLVPHSLPRLCNQDMPVTGLEVDGAPCRVAVRQLAGHAACQAIRSSSTICRSQCGALLKVDPGFFLSLQLLN